MPHPPTLRGTHLSLQLFFEDFRQESSFALTRHEEILSRVIKHQEQLAEHHQQLADVREISKHICEAMVGNGSAHCITGLPTSPRSPKGKKAQEGNVSECRLEVAEGACLDPEQKLARGGSMCSSGDESPKQTRVQRKRDLLFSTLATVGDKVQHKVQTKTRKLTTLAKNSKLDIHVNRNSRTSEMHSGAKSCWKRAAAGIVAHRRFEVFIAFLIQFNAIVMCFDGQHAGLGIGHELKYKGYTATLQETWPNADIVFEVFDWFFGVLFFTEVVLKITCFSCQYFCNIWNWLDFVCVLAFVLDKVAGALLPNRTRALRLLRLMRLCRLVRVIRNLESLDVLFVMVTAIKEMSMVLLWAVALLTVIFMACALLLTETLHSTYFKDMQSSSMSADELATHQKMFEYFGTTSRCLLSMFELALANWPPVTRLLAEEFSEWFMLVCVAHKLVIGFAVIGVINGVIMQETFKVAATDDMIMVRQKKQAKATLSRKMHKLFEALDHDDNGQLDYGEFEIIASQPEVKLWLGSMDIETVDLETLFRLVDLDLDGTISPQELCEGMSRLKGAARSIDIVALREDFKMMKLQMGDRGKNDEALRKLIALPAMQ